MVRVFISYARVDYPLISPVIDILEQGGHDAWYDHKLIVGQNWENQLCEAIISCDVFFYAITPESTISKWCQWELSKAVQLGKPILPVLMQAKTEVPESLKSYMYADLSKGITPEAVARLLGGLANLISPQRFFTSEKAHQTSAESTTNTFVKVYVIVLKGKPTK